MTTATSSERHLPLPLRSDTFLGVCEAIGQDLGFNSNWLRALFAVLLLWNPEVIVGAYLGLGAVVAATRLLLPDSRPAVAPTAQESASAPDGDDTAARENEELMAA